MTRPFYKYKLSELKKRADMAISKLVRARDGKCLMCGTTHGLDCHHALHTKGSSPTRYRWDIRNLITVCRTCHNRIHADEEGTLRDVMLAMVIHGIATRKEINQILKDKRPLKADRHDLIELIKKVDRRLKDELI